METNFIELRDENSSTSNAHVMVLTENFVDTIDECRTGYYDSIRDRVILKKEVKEGICLFEAGKDLEPKQRGIYELRETSNNNSMYEYIRKI